MLYILTGRPFAGKSTLRKELVERLGFSVASVDWEIDNRGLHVVEMTQDDWNLVYSEAYEKLKKLLKEGKTVVLDLANLKRQERNTAREIAKSLGVKYKLIYVNTTFEDAEKRWNNNKNIAGARKMDESVFNRGQSMFEEPTADENPIIYNSSIDLDHWIQNYILK